MVIDRLQEEIVRLKARLRYQERTAKEGPFGSSTPSAKVPLKANTPPENSQRRGGAKPGHRGHGRRDIPDAEVTREESVPGWEQCPYCGGPLDRKGSKPRTIIEVDPYARRSSVMNWRNVTVAVVTALSPLDRLESLPKDSSATNY